MAGATPRAEARDGAARPPAERNAVRAELLTIDVADDQLFQAAWRALGGDVVEENPFYAPWALAPALGAYGDDKVRLACVWHGEGPSAQLIGLLPVRARRGYTHLPFSYWESWTYPHCFFTAPLVRRGFEDAFFLALFDLLGAGPERRMFLHLHRVDRDGPLVGAAHKAACANARVSYDICAAERAVLFAGASAEATLAVHVRKKKRKELKRLRNRLEEQGRIIIRELNDREDLERWVEDFLVLEHKGWKGDKATSLKTRAEDTDWFRQMAAGAFADGRLHFIRMDIDDRPIAMLVNLVANGAGYSLKIAHDPDYDKFSPGVMIEIEAMRALLGLADFRFMDSCAAPDHSMINGLWRARRMITGVNISAAGLRARAGLSFCRMIEGSRASAPVSQPEMGAEQ